MADVQKHLEAFNSKIRLGRFKEEQTLRDKRDIIRNKLLVNLPAVFAKYNEPNLVPRFRDQGSYEMKTGIRPLNGDFDIDQGVYFDVSTTDYPDPVKLKERVDEALVGHTNKVRVRRPCVTVFYQRDGESVYHVDLAVYSAGSANRDGKDYLAMGRLGSADEHRFWQVSDPEGLAEEIYRRFEEDEPARHQFRRVIRYLKRWRAVNFPQDGSGAPRGIALTVDAHYGFDPAYTDRVAKTPDDLRALRSLVVAVLARFTDVYDSDSKTWVRRVRTTLPVEPRSDLYEKMTGTQATTYEEKLKGLRDALDSAIGEVDPVEACKTLRRVFGDDFPVPEKAATAQRVGPAVASSASAA